MKKPAIIQIISRYAPAPNRSGPFTYLFDVMVFLASQGYTLDFVILDPWFKEERLDATIRQIATVTIMRLETPNVSLTTPSLKMLLRPIYTSLPTQILRPVRALWYRFRNQPIPGIHRHDAPATPEEKQFISQRIAEIQPEIVFANHTCLGNLFEDHELFQGRLTAIITHHIESQRTADFQQARLSVRHDAAWGIEQEKALLQYADTLVAIQLDDAKVLQQLSPSADVLVVPMSARLIPHNPSEQIPGRCLFVGSSIDHNVHGMTWFLREVWPLVFAKEPQVTLHICGTVCESLTQFAAPNIQLLGRVDDLNAEYGAAQVCLIPLIAGSGLKIKLVEAFSHGRACVSTSVGVQGVRELANRAVFVADAPPEFAAAVVRLLKQPETRTAMEKNARQYVMERLTPEQAYRPLLDRFQQFYARHERQTL